MLILLLQHAQRSEQGRLHVPVVNPADKFQEKADSLHQYGQYLLSALPKYIQQCVSCHSPKIYRN